MPVMEGYPTRARALTLEMIEAASARPEAAVAFQGAPGAYSHEAALSLDGEVLALPCASFADAMVAVSSGRAARAAIPIENNLYGRVADVHVLLPESGLHVVGERYHRVRHCLLGAAGARLDAVRRVISHPQALGQCRRRLAALGLAPEAWIDTAGAAAEVAERQDPALAAIASALAARLYGCEPLLAGIEDEGHNRTRFLVLARTPLADPGPGPLKTSLAFEVKNHPAALFKALGGFATNGVNLTRLESHLRGGGFTAAEFLIDIEGSPQDPPVARALEELAFHSRWVRLFGTYPAQSLSSVGG